MHTATNTHGEPLTRDEAAFAADMGDFYRRAGEAAAWQLLSKMTGDSEDGCTRQGHARTVRQALARLPTIQ